MSADAQVVTKRDATLPAEAFAWEAAGLDWLAEARGTAIARVVDVDDASLATERVTEAGPSAAAAEAFGRSLAATHAAGADAFCAPPPAWSGDGWIGRQRQPMRPRDTWGASFAEQRILPFVARARDAGNLEREAAGVVERVCARLADGAFDDDRPPARIHGDLWSGNVLWGEQGVVLIDPAAHGGHPLTDLAMLALFGLPHLETVHAAYDEAAGLADGWRELLPLHQLHPLAVHAASHGPAYGAALERAARMVA